MATLRVEVSEALIARGGLSCVSCPVALALAAVLPVVRKVYVFCDRIWIDGYPHEAPERARAFVLQYDLWPRDERHPDLEPFAFELEVEDKLLEPIRLGGVLCA